MFDKCPSCGLKDHPRPGGRAKLGQGQGGGDGRGSLLLSLLLPALRETLSFWDQMGHTQTKPAVLFAQPQAWPALHICRETPSSGEGGGYPRSRVQNSKGVIAPAWTLVCYALRPPQMQGLAKQYKIRRKGLGF